MSTWAEFAAAAPDLAAAVEGRFRATKHHVLATLRRDGSPRVSGTEVELGEGELRLGSMSGAVKAIDLQRDGRFALHSNPGDGSMAGGDAKVAGMAFEITDQGSAGEFHQFRLDLDEVVLTTIHPDGDRLVIEVWRTGDEIRRIERH